VASEEVDAVVVHERCWISAVQSLDNRIIRFDWSSKVRDRNESNQDGQKATKVFQHRSNGHHYLVAKSSVGATQTGTEVRLLLCILYTCPEITTRYENSREEY
jgi:hypothetical protein